MQGAQVGAVALRDGVIHGQAHTSLQITGPMRATNILCRADVFCSPEDRRVRFHGALRLVQDQYVFFRNRRGSGRGCDKDAGSGQQF
jgi:hypothetical protein